MEPDWASQYLNYDRLKEVLKNLEARRLAVPDDGIGTSLSTPLPTTVEGVQLDTITSQEEFFSLLDQEMKKIETFTKERVDEYREALVTIERRIDELIAKYPDRDEMMRDPETDQCRQVVQSCGNSFLRLEKYVNLNFMGFVKILKKHDKHLPNPCRAFYTSRLHEQSWVRGDYSDVMVSMSRIYSKLRKDKVVEESDDAKQNFVRSTRKYWVHTEDISAVKYTVLQHLPVFLQAGMNGESDSQLTTSIYVDNYAMELYKGRLEKSPGAIALRFRWYGSKPAETVYVERKTHREKWMGEMSVKERFTVKEPQVMELLRGTFDLNAETVKLRAKNKKEDDIAEYQLLATEIAQAIQSKQLFPTMRTQYMRTAFQIPFDPSVRISLDTNLTMINERTSEILAGERWFRDPNKATIPPQDITRFPHAVLEIKLQLQDESDTPAWVNDLINSGKLLEVHKFSKFLHGCAVLLPDDVPAMPYWIDDVTLADSIIKSGAAHIIAGADQRQDNPMLPHDPQGNAKARLDAIARGDYVPSTPVRTTPLPIQLPASNGKGASSTNLSGAGSPVVESTKSLSTPSSPSYGVHNHPLSSTSLSTYNNSNPMHQYGSTVAAAQPSTGVSQRNTANKGNSNGSPSKVKPGREVQADSYYRMSDEDLEGGQKSDRGPCGCWQSCCGVCGPFLTQCFGGDSEDGLCSWADAPTNMKKMSAQKVEPKIFFANERTFLSWLNMAVFMSSMAIAVMAFASNGGTSLVFAFVLMPMSLLFIGYALNTFLARGKKISARDAERWDDPYGPPLLAALLALALFAIFVVKVVQIAL